MMANAGVDRVPVDFLIYFRSEVLGRIPKTIQQTQMLQPVACFAQHVFGGQADKGCVFSDGKEGAVECGANDTGGLATGGGPGKRADIGTVSITP